MMSLSVFAFHSSSCNEKSNTYIQIISGNWKGKGGDEGGRSALHLVLFSVSFYFGFCSISSNLWIVFGDIECMCVSVSLCVCVCKRIVRHFRTRTTRTTIDETAVVSTHAKEVSAAADVAVKARWISVLFIFASTTTPLNLFLFPHKYCSIIFFLLCSNFILYFVHFRISLWVDNGKLLWSFLFVSSAGVGQGMRGNNRRAEHPGERAWECDL